MVRPTDLTGKEAHCLRQYILYVYVYDIRYRVGPGADPGVQIDSQPVGEFKPTTWQ